jgi:hypothetical protein
LKKVPKNKILKKAKRSSEKDCISREEKYEEQEKLFKRRNSYLKTDHDAVFMRMKEDHLLNRQLKAGYNIQMGTQNHFVVGYSIHQQAGDTSCLKPHLEDIRDWLGEYPESLIADAGYGSEENYAYLKENQLTAYVKYNTFHYEQKRRYKKNKNKYRLENFKYLPDEDQFECPQEKRLICRYTTRFMTENGYAIQRRIYIGTECQNCPVMAECTKSKYQRELWVEVELMKMKKSACEHLLSPSGIEVRSQRPIEVEAVFGRLKQN